MNIAVYCGSAYGTDPEYACAARLLGEAIGKRGHTLVYGGSDTGLMGTVADAVLAQGAKVTGVVPNVHLAHEKVHDGISQLFFEDTIARRKDRMIELSDAYIALPGGVGTLDEISDILCLTRNHVINGPVVFVNTNGFYEPVRSLFGNMVNGGFIGAEELDNVLFSADVTAILDFIERYTGAS